MGFNGYLCYSAVMCGQAGYPDHFVDKKQHQTTFRRFWLTAYTFSIQLNEMARLFRRGLVIADFFQCIPDELIFP
jgi:hypothetical protein